MNLIISEQEIRKELERHQTDWELRLILADILAQQDKNIEEFGQRWQVHYKRRPYHDGYHTYTWCNNDDGVMTNVEKGLSNKYMSALPKVIYENEHGIYYSQQNAEIVLASNLHRVIAQKINVFQWSLSLLKEY